MGRFAFAVIVVYGSCYFYFNYLRRCNRTLENHPLLLVMSVFPKRFLFQKRQLPFASFFQMPDIQIFKLRQFWEIWNGNHDWITTLLPS